MKPWAKTAHEQVDRKINRKAVMEMEPGNKQRRWRKLQETVTCCWRDRSSEKDARDRLESWYRKRQSRGRRDCRDLVPSCQGIPFPPREMQMNLPGPSLKVPASQTKNRSCGCCQWKGMGVGKSYGMGRLFCSNDAIAAPGAGKKKKKLKTPVKITCDGSADLSNFMLTLLHVKQEYDT